MCKLITSDRGAKMDGSFQYNAFYPKAGNAAVPSQFRIASFSCENAFIERGLSLTDVAFNWVYLNGSPVSQAILPGAESIAANKRSFTLAGQTIETDTAFTLHASDGYVNRQMTARVKFVYPILFGGVSSAIPKEAELHGLSKRVSEFNALTATVNLADQHSCFVTPMTNPIVDIRDRLFGLSIWGSYDVIDNYFVTMADGLIIPCRVVVKSVPEHTLGIDLQLDIIF